MPEPPVDCVAPIATTPVTTCPLCGSAGEVAYRNLRDVLFGVPGAWTLRECGNPSCGLLWLDPMPQPAEVGRLYAHYYTHVVPESDTDGPATSGASRGLQRAGFRLLWGRHARKRLNDFYLRRKGGGRLLEVGCGDGRRLARFRAGGWTVEGQEVDAKAAQVAKDRFGLDVHLGELADLNLPADRYDAVALNHVIEHVHEPAELLGECRRLLAPGGRLIVITPNSAALGRRTFGPYWRGLEPPRHLHIFNRQALAALAARAGFVRYQTWTTAAKAETFAQGSLMIARQTSGGSHATAVRMRPLGSSAFTFQMRAWLRSWFDRGSGEEVVLSAYK